MEVSARPILEALDQYNGKPTEDKLLTLNSKQENGPIIDHNIDTCPWWLGGGNNGYRIDLAWPQSLSALMYIGQIDHTWGVNGLEFSFDNTLAIGGVFVIGSVKLCGITLPVDPGLVAFIDYTRHANGSAELTPVLNSGLKYHIRTTQPLYFAGLVEMPPFSFSAPFWFTTELTKGTIPNIVGQQGDVQISATGKVRHFSLGFDFNDAHNLSAGVAVSGPVSIHWND